MPVQNLKKTWKNAAMSTKCEKTHTDSLTAFLRYDFMVSCVTGTQCFRDWPDPVCTWCSFLTRSWENVFPRPDSKKYTKGSQLNTIVVRLAAKSIEFNQI